MFNNHNQPQNFMMNMVKQFNQFKKSFQGDPKAQVQELLNTGRMSQAQFNQLRQMAEQFKSMLGN
jgi:hypothetical protein